MKRRITRLTVLQTGKLLATLYGFLSIILLPFVLIGVIANSRNLAMLLMLFAYPIIGFVGGIVLAIFYNFAAKWMGGLEIEEEAMEIENRLY